MAIKKLETSDRVFPALTWLRALQDRKKVLRKRANEDHMVAQYKKAKASVEKQAEVLRKIQKEIDTENNNFEAELKCLKAIRKL